MPRFSISCVLPSERDRPTIGVIGRIFTTIVVADDQASALASFQQQHPQAVAVCAVEQSYYIVYCTDARRCKWFGLHEGPTDRAQVSLSEAYCERCRGKVRLGDRIFVWTEAEVATHYQSMGKQA